MNQDPAKKNRSGQLGKETPNPADGAIVNESVERLREELEEKVALLSKTNRQLKRKIFDLYTIFEISRNFNAILDYESLLETFIFTCLGQVGVLKGAIFLKNDINDRDYCIVKAKGSGDFPGRQQCFRDDTKLAEYLTRLNRPLLIDEISSDMASPEETEILKNFQHGVVVPLIYQTRLEGLFLLADRMTERDFTPDDMEFLSALGNQISVAIENARLYEAEKTAIQQLRAAQQQLVQSERLAALGEMSAKIAHEVNNPLGIIKNYILLFKRATRGNEELNEHLETVSQEIDRIAGIVRQLHGFQRPIRMELVPVDVRAVLEDTLKLMERQLQSKDISIVRRFESGEKKSLVNGSADSLKQVFLNLIINARVAMDRGGTLTIMMKRQEEDLLLRFCDTGAGIPPEVIPRIFEPFFSTKGDEGTGLGLSVCYGIIKSHKGSITFKNLDAGGCFDILLPLHDEQKKHGKAN